MDTGLNMVAIESLVVLFTACIIYILSSSRRSKSRFHNQEDNKKKPSSSWPTWPVFPLTHLFSLFSCSATPSATANISQQPPYAMPPLKPNAAHPTSMGLKRLNQSNWLTIDAHYNSEHALRASLLETCKPNVLQVLPGAEPACHELLEQVVSFLTTRYPQSFTLHARSSTIYSHLTQETFAIGAKCENPLETAARLCMEDFNILIKDPESGEFRLMASATLFPAGWKLQERIGSSMAALHAPVPGWKEKLGRSVDRYFTHLTSKSCMERSNLFIQTTPVLFQDVPEVPSASLTADDIFVRRERQTFTRLERSEAVLFTVRTYMEKLVDMDAEEVETLGKQVRGWEEEMAKYKGIEGWGKVCLEFCDEVTAAREGERGGNVEEKS
ncbi:mannosyl transferase protein [Rutstroemia sp. NJR-2017a BVV2]|nr:mannosyl transferase protein [Rutstroemia sp. NJR-2017a BVV2]